MIKDIDSSAQPTVSQECKIIYKYLRQCAATNSPPETIQKFQNLFQCGKDRDIRVTAALEKIAFSAKQDFDAFLNNCFYIILSCWIESSESTDYADRLLATLNIITQNKSLDRRRKQLVVSIENYQQTKHYRQLRAIIAIVNPQQTNRSSIKNSFLTNESIEPSSNNNSNQINAYLVRYTYLYSYFSPDDDSSNQLSALLDKLKDKRQKDFEILLSKHVIYRFRLKQLAKMKLMAQGAGKMIIKADNPSLLSEKAFRVALQNYVAKTDGKSTLQERSQLFIANNKNRTNYEEFKADLWAFLIDNIQPRNNTYQFSRRLKQKLDSIFPKSDAKPINSTLILQTCRQLFSFLVIDPTVSDNPEEFAELVANLGTAQAIAILVKIVLICPESKTDLEKKVGSVVTYYQFDNYQEIPWLLKSLEHLLFAFSIYYGSLDVSIVRSAVSR